MTICIIRARIQAAQKAYERAVCRPMLSAALNHRRRIGEVVAGWVSGIVQIESQGSPYAGADDPPAMDTAARDNIKLPGTETMSRLRRFHALFAIDNVYRLRTVMRVDGRR